MRHLVICSLLILAGMGWSAVWAGPPIAGDYQTTDLGGSIHIGHYTEGWLPGGGAVLVGTTLNAGSWDGASFGTEWRYWCATEQAPGVVLVNTVNASGNGNRTYMKTFSGGYLWLSGAGPWANGDAEYPGVIETYTEFETVQYSNWVPVAAVTNVQATGHFDNYPSDCLTFAVSNGFRVGTTDLGGVKPATYPDFLAAGTCAPGLTNGAWWDMVNMTLSIATCQVSAEPTGWSNVKALYR